MTIRLRFVDDFISLFFPRLCLACGKNTPQKKELICISCQYHLPKTKFHLEKENKFTQRFLGRLELQSGAALYYFTKGGRTQHLIHQLKYKGKREVGVMLGQHYGELLKDSPHFKDIDLIVPVPMHPKKEHMRGYNQSTQFAKGLSETMEKPYYKKALKKITHTISQTKKTRFERLQNVINTFEVNQVNALKRKHVLLVDDVLTTGATLEACGLKILEVEDTKLSMLTIAIATH
ncbi:MAG TPA: ComF family protein [Saprospiraceae bacterium]|nr:ComF family protein [Saprospiraceae bacterium]